MCMPTKQAPYKHSNGSPCWTVNCSRGNSRVYKRENGMTVQEFSLPVTPEQRIHLAATYAVILNKDNTVARKIDKDNPERFTDYEAKGISFGEVKNIFSDNNIKISIQDYGYTNIKLRTDRITGEKSFIMSFLAPENYIVRNLSDKYVAQILKIITDKIGV